MASPPSRHCEMVFGWWMAGGWCALCNEPMHCNDRLGVPLGQKNAREYQTSVSIHISHGCSSLVASGIFKAWTFGGLPLWAFEAIIRMITAPHMLAGDAIEHYLGAIRNESSTVFLLMM